MNIRIFSLIFFCVISLPLCSTPQSSHKKSQLSQTITPAKSLLHHCVKESWEVSKILALTTAAFVAYGILHHQYIAPTHTKKSALDHMTKHIPALEQGKFMEKLKAKDLKSLGNHCKKSLFFGLGAGLLFGTVSRFGERKKHTAQDLLKPLATIIIALTTSSALIYAFPELLRNEQTAHFLPCQFADETAKNVRGLGIAILTFFILHQRLKVTDPEQEKKAIIAKLKNLQNRKI